MITNSEVIVMRISTLFWHLKHLNVTFTYIRWDGMGWDDLGVLFCVCFEQSRVI